MTGLEVKFAYLSCSVLECCERCEGRRWETPWSRCLTPPATLSSQGTSRGPTWGRSTENKISDQLSTRAGAGAGAGAPRMTPIKEDDRVQMEQRCKSVPAISSLSKGKLTDLKLSCLCLPASCSQDSDMSFLYKWRWSMKGRDQNRRLKKIMTKTFPLAL